MVEQVRVVLEARVHAALRDGGQRAALRADVRLELLEQQHLERLVADAAQLDEPQDALGQLVLDGLVQRNPQLLRNLLRDPIHVSKGKAEYPAYVPDGRPRLQGSEGHDLGDLHRIVAAARSHFFQRIHPFF